MPEDQLALLQSQDIRYIRQRRQLETKKLARLTAELHLLDAEGKPKNTHVFFTDDKQQGSYNGLLGSGELCIITLDGTYFESLPYN